ncbi:hypothetical protein SAY87_010676 [Trapa incisa]|uniref:RRM domain-containing protein n=1 Tax=Trapa incisa TaxID=236973 RepID=A0AAN7GLU6_9MYRT|nr:hypothetical protein SAY87_010676 [Trapa incisa]
MSSATGPVFKPLSITGSCLHRLPTLDTTLYPYLSIPHKPIKLRPFFSHAVQLANPLKKNTRRPSQVVYAADASGWSPTEGESAATATLEWGVEEGEAQVSDWEGRGGPVVVEGGIFEGEEETPVEEPPEEVKLFVGNLPYDIDSEKLAMMFEQAGVVEIAEVIYNRDTDQSRGFGFVTMSTVEEAEKAVETFNQYDLGGRLLTVNKAAPRGSRAERAPRTFGGSSFRIYAGNLSWDVNDARLEQVFSDHGKVISARVVLDRETGRSRGFGFVTMASETEMNNAIAALDGQTLDGRAIRVNVAEERPSRSF